MFLVVCRACFSFARSFSIIDRSPVQMWNRFQTTDATADDDHLCCFVRHNAISIRMSKCRENENNERQRLILSSCCFEREWPYGETYAHLCVCFPFIVSGRHHHHCYLIDSIMTFQQHALAWNEVQNLRCSSATLRKQRHWNRSLLFVILGKCMALILITNSMYPLLFI